MSSIDSADQLYFRANSLDAQISYDFIPLRTYSDWNCKVQLVYLSDTFNAV